MEHKIAIIKGKECYYNYGESMDIIIQSITDWEIVSDEEYKLLCSASYEFNFSIVEQCIDQKEFIGKTVSEYISLVEERKRQKEAREEALRQKNLEKKLKREELSLKKKRELFEKLKEELSPDDSNQDQQ